MLMWKVNIPIRSNSERYMAIPICSKSEICRAISGRLFHQELVWSRDNTFDGSISAQTGNDQVAGM